MSTPNPLYHPASQPPGRTQPNQHGNGWPHNESTNQFNTVIAAHGSSNPTHHISPIDQLSSNPTKDTLSLPRSDTDTANLRPIPRSNTGRENGTRVSELSFLTSRGCRDGGENEGRGHSACVYTDFYDADDERDDEGNSSDKDDEIDLPFPRRSPVLSGVGRAPPSGEPQTLGGVITRVPFVFTTSQLSGASPGTTSTTTSALPLGEPLPQDTPEQLHSAPSPPDTPPVALIAIPQTGGADAVHPDDAPLTSPTLSSSSSSSASSASTLRAWFDMPSPSASPARPMPSSHPTSTTTNTRYDNYDNYDEDTDDEDDDDYAPSYYSDTAYDEASPSTTSGDDDDEEGDVEGGGWEEEELFLWRGSYVTASELADTIALVGQELDGLGDAAWAGLLLGGDDAADADADAHVDGSEPGGGSVFDGDRESDVDSVWDMDNEDEEEERVEEGDVEDDIGRWGLNSPDDVASLPLTP